MLDAKVFKAYDVRGIYPSELDEQGGYAIGRAFVEQFEPKRIAVGHDMRVSSPSMAEAVIRGASEAGAAVLELGLVGTEMLYFAVGDLGLEGGIAVTASHNPKDYTGMKIVRSGALPVGGESGLLEIRDRALSLSDTPRGLTPGQVQPYDIWEQYVERVLSFVDPEAIKPLKVVVDAANGMAGVMLPPVLERLPQVETVRCYFEPDGTFPNHEPNPLLPENRQFIIDKVNATGADLGIAWDGDADRCFFIDDGGEFVDGDFLTAILAEHLLAKTPGATILFDARASRAVPDTVSKAGGRALINRVGHAFFKARMPKEGAIFGGEVSGHYYFADFYNADSGSLPALLVLEKLSIEGRRMSELVGAYREKYFISGEINSDVLDQDAKMAEIEERYSDGDISHVDGVSVDYDAWHFNVRPSNTEPLLRLCLESLVSREDMERRRDEVLGLIRS